MSEYMKRMLFPLQTQDEIDFHWGEFLKSRGYNGEKENE